jgi:stage V sporulation protein AE
MIFIKACIIGGLLCVVGQILVDKTKLTPGRILVLFVVAGVVLQAVGVFEPLKNFAGSGATVPLLGFGAALAEGTKELIDEKGAIGIFAGPLTAGAGGIAITILSALIMSVFTKPGAK